MSNKPFKVCNAFKFVDCDVDERECVVVRSGCTKRRNGFVNFRSDLILLLDDDDEEEKGRTPSVMFSCRNIRQHEYLKE
eukprot:3594193-Ditylum_brightwellii.AAC.1